MTRIGPGIPELRHCHCKRAGAAVTFRHIGQLQRLYMASSLPSCGILWHASNCSTAVGCRVTEGVSAFWYWASWCGSTLRYNACTCSLSVIEPKSFQLGVESRSGVGSALIRVRKFWYLQPTCNPMRVFWHVSGFWSQIWPPWSPVRRCLVLDLSHLGWFSLVP